MLLSVVDPSQAPLNQLLAGHTGQSIETIDRDTERDNFMGAETAAEYGLIDEVLKTRSPVPVKA